MLAGPNVSVATVHKKITLRDTLWSMGEARALTVRSRENPISSNTHGAGRPPASFLALVADRTWRNVQGNRRRQLSREQARGSEASRHGGRTVEMGRPDAGAALGGRAAGSACALGAP